VRNKVVPDSLHGKSAKDNLIAAERNDLTKLVDLLIATAEKR
jgi:hypothetical protein